MTGIHTFEEAIWLVDGPPVHDFGFVFPTRMIVVKLADGSLWINSPVPVAPEDLDQIKAWGVVRYLVAPTKLHVWRLEEWHALFPEAELWAPPQVPCKFRSLPFTGVLGDNAPGGWATDLDQIVFRGNLFIDEVFFLHKKSRTVIVADFIQNHRKRDGKPLLNALIKLAGAAYPHGGVPWDIRFTFFRREAGRQSLEKLLSWDFDRLILAHGVCIEKDAKEFVEKAFRWLGKKG
ncbi:MAG: DUF4336 domain-containing protein [Chthoniobacteraceae bacterium]